MNNVGATAVILLVAAAIRLFVIPRFTLMPGRLQLFLEQGVQTCDAVAGWLVKVGQALKRAAVGFVRGLAGTGRAVGGFCTRHVRELIALIRLFLVPRLSLVPGRLQLVLETVINLLDGLAGVADNKSLKIPFIGAYVFAAGVYIFTGTLFELFGVQAVTTHGTSVTLPAPLSDVNAAICMGCLSYLVILVGGAVHRGRKGLIAALKEFSLPISMSFRLFGALLSGLLVTDLVYHYASLSYGIPVIVGVIFTLLHAVVQTYVLTMLVGMYYKEVTEEEVEKKQFDEFSV